MLFTYENINEATGYFQAVTMMVTVKRNSKTEKFVCFLDNDNETHTFSQTFYSSDINYAIHKVDEWNKSMPDSWGYMLKDIDPKKYSPLALYEKIYAENKFKRLYNLDDLTGSIIK